MTASRLDARGMMCPQPVIEVQKIIAELAVGTVLTVLVTDAAAPIDLEVWCLQHGHRYQNAHDRGEWLEITLTKV